MSSAPSVPGVEVGASWLGGCEHVLTAGALELLAALHRTFGPRRAELPGPAERRMVIKCTELWCEDLHGRLRDSNTRWTDRSRQVWPSIRAAASTR